MAIKISGATVITNSRRGVFRSVNPGTYATASRPPGASEGDVIYDSDEKAIYVYNGTEWVSTGSGGEVNNLNPAIPPFVSKTGPATNITNSDGKVEFSLDGNSWSSSINIPSETIYYCDWTNDILSAAHDSQYETSIGVTYPNLDTSQSIELNLKIDKLPDPFTLDTETDVVGLLMYFSNTISPLNSINAPTAIWGSSDATNPQIAIADGAWEALPTTINTRYVNMNDRIRVRHTAGGNTDYPYTTTLNIGYGTGAGEFETSDFVTRTANVVYNQPTITPGSNTEIDRNGQVFTMSAPTGTNVNHVATDWIFASDSAFSNILEQSLNDSSNLLTYTLSGISNNQTVYAKGTFVDSSGIKSPDAIAENLTAKDFYVWRYQFHIEGGWGGNSTGSNGGGQGGQGYVVIESLTTSPSSPAGTAEWYNGRRGFQANQAAEGQPRGEGAFGIDGGNQGFSPSRYSGGGGGAAAIKLNGDYLAGVGGGGGASWGPDGTGGDIRGGRGGSLPNDNGTAGSGAFGGAQNGVGGTSSSTPSNGQGGDGNGSGAGAGGGGFGGGGGGTFNSSEDRSGGSGGGGASWNQSINYTNGNYKLTHAQSTNVTASGNSVSKYRALSTSPTTWVLVTQNDTQGVVNLG